MPRTAAEDYRILRRRRLPSVSPAAVDLQVRVHDKKASKEASAWLTHVIGTVLLGAAGRFQSGVAPPAIRIADNRTDALRLRLRPGWLFTVCLPQRGRGHRCTRGHGKYHRQQRGGRWPARARHGRRRPHQLSRMGRGFFRSPMSMVCVVTRSSTRAAAPPPHHVRWPSARAASWMDSRGAGGRLGGLG